MRRCGELYTWRAAAPVALGPIRTSKQIMFAALQLPQTCHRWQRATESGRQRSAERAQLLLAVSSLMEKQSETIVFSANLEGCSRALNHRSNGHSSSSAHRSKVPWTHRSRNKSFHRVAPRFEFSEHIRLRRAQKPLAAIHPRRRLYGKE